MKSPAKVLTLRAVNFYRGLPQKPFRGLLRKIYFKYFQAKMKEDKRVLAKIDGIKYELNLSQYSELETYYGGGYEPEVIKIIHKYVKPGMTAIDIGARIGLHALRIKKLVGKEGQLIAIEPDKRTYPSLLKNAQLNNFSIIAENIAFTDKNSENESTLDNYIEKKGIKRLDFVKLDTDGFEYQIIKGGMNTLKKFKPVMVVEFNRKSFEDKTLEPMVDLLKGIGYSFFEAKSLKECLSKKEMFDAIEVGGVSNFLCKIR